MKNVLITGGSSGIGLAAADTFAEKGYHVIIAARSESKLLEGVNSIKAKYKNASISYLTVDLADFSAVRSFASKVKSVMPVIDILVLNAGLYTAPEYQYGKSGYEMMISATHLGHFLLTKILLDNVKAASDGRIVVTSSEGHRIGFLNIDSFTKPKFTAVPYVSTIFGYGQAKLANILFTRELAKKLVGTSVRVNCFHPGAVASGFTRDVPKIIDKIAQSTLISPEKGARTLVYLADDTEAASFNGEYFIGKKVREPAFQARNDKSAKVLWEESERIVSRF